MPTTDGVAAAAAQKLMHMPPAFHTEDQQPPSAKDGTMFIASKPDKYQFVPATKAIDIQNAPYAHANDQIAFAQQQQILHFAAIIGIALIVFLLIYWRRIARAAARAAKDGSSNLKEGSLNVAATGLRLGRKISEKASGIHAEIERRSTAPRVSDRRTEPRDNQPSS